MVQTTTRRGTASSAGSSEQVAQEVVRPAVPFCGPAGGRAGETGFGSALPIVVLSEVTQERGARRLAGAELERMPRLRTIAGLEAGEG
jgi:hypothetical protein